MRCAPLNRRSVMARPAEKWTLVVGVLLYLCGAGCRQHTYSLAFPERKESAGMSITLSAPDLPALPLPDPNRLFDWSLLDMDGFYPPGCEKIEPNGPVRLTLAPDHGVRFPTTERYGSPDGRFVLVHDGWERRKKKVLHWLMLVTANESVPKSVFGTEHAFDVLWAPESEYFAITHYPGGNMSEVLAVAARDGAKEEIPARAAAIPYFIDGISERTVAKAYRWTTNGALVVRGLSRGEKEPYDLVGFEILADVTGPGGRIQLRFLRGFVCRGR